jgi:hypothetical protein
VAGHDKARDYTFTATVKDGRLNINVTTDINNAKLSAIMVTGST